MKNPESKQAISTENYISNPFKLAFGATSKFFDTNKWWAIAIVVFGLLGGFPGGGSSNSPTNDTPVAETIGSNPDVSTAIAVVIFIAGLVIFFLLLVIVVGTYIQGMLSYVALQSEKGKAVKFKEAFSEVSARFWRLFGAHLLAVIKIVGWTMLLIVPGIIAALRYSLLSYVVMDEPKEEKSVKASHDRVKAITHKRLWEVLGVSFTGIIPIIGSLLSLAGGSALYRQLQVYTDKNIEKPKIHWLNYLALVLIAFVVVIGVAIALVIASN